MIDDLLAVQVGGDFCLLAGMDVLELHFLEVGVDIGVADGHNGHQRRTDLDLLADFDRLFRDDAVGRRADHGAVKRQLGGVELGLGGQDFRVLIGGDTGEQGRVGLALTGCGIDGRGG